nr:glycosyltransferase family 1 protein [Larsenimonas salina]
MAPLTGVGHYTRELTRILVSKNASHGINVHGLAGPNISPLNSESSLLKESPCSSGYSSKSKANGALKRYMRNPLTRHVYRAALTYRLQWYRLQKPDAAEAVYWEPNFIRLPWQGKSVITVHDLSHKRFPEYHPKERVSFLNRNLENSLKKADRINVVSEFTAEELTTLYGINQGRIDIVPPGVSERFFYSNVIDQQRVIAKYQMPSHYCLSVGTLEPRKNLNRLIEAFLTLPPEQQRYCPLILVGMQGWGDAISPEASKAINAGRIRLLGYIADEDLPALYANATFFAYLSLYEGFGMPIVEAMAAGVPVITSDRGATREVASSAALCVDPENIEEIRAAMILLLEDNNKSKQLMYAGKERAGQFNWHHSFELLVSSLKRV